MADTFSKRLTERVQVNIKESGNNDSFSGRVLNNKRMSRMSTSSLSQQRFEAVSNILVAPEAEDSLRRSPQEVMRTDLEQGRAYHDMVSADTALSIKQSNDILSALPDIELAMRLKVSSILSPNDMVSKELIYSSSETLFGDVTKLLLDVIQDYFDKDYKINDQLTDMLNKALFKEGSYTKVILPESSIDELINSNLLLEVGEGTENAKAILDIGTESKGFITHTKADNEVANALGISVTDDFNLFKLPGIKRKRRTDTSARHLFPGLLSSSADKHEGEKGVSTLYPKRENTMVNILMLKNLKDLDKPSVGHPTDITIPAEAFIPVHRPSDPSIHEGGFILLDESGNPVRNRDVSDQGAQLASGHQESIAALTANLIQASSDDMTQSAPQSSKEGTTDPEYMSLMYSTLLEKQLRETLDSAEQGESDVSVGLHSEVQRIMMTRALKKLKTKLVYVPKELVSYLAFEYKDNGTGIGLIEKTKTISSMRMVQEVADAISNVRNAIDHKDAVIKLDAEDQQPMKTLNDVLHNIQNSMMAQTPLGSLNMNDIAKNFQMHGWNVRTEGHDAMPDMSVEYNQSTRNYPKPDSEYGQKLQDQQTKAFGLTPDSLAGAFDAETATAIISNNIFLARDAMDSQEVFSSFLTDFIQKYSISSSILVGELEKIIDKNRNIISANKKYSSKLLAILFINNLNIALPKPDLSKLDMQSKAVETYSSMVDKVMEYFITEDSFGSSVLGDEPGEAINAIRSVVKEAAMRKYISDNNIMPEIFELIYGTSYQSDKLSVLKAHQNSVDHLMPLISKWLTRNKVRSKKSNKFNEDVNNVLSEDGDVSEANYGDTSSGMGDNPEDGDTDDDDFTDDDDNLDETGNMDDNDVAGDFDEINEMEDLDLGDDE